MKAFILVCLSLFSLDTMAQKMNYPVTERGNQSDNYFGREVKDPYRWLENDTAKNTEAWVKKQNAVTHAYLDKIPFREKIKNRLTELWNYPKYSAPSLHGDYLLFFKNDGLQNQAVLYVQKGEEGEPQVLLDPNKMSADGTVALQATSFSKNQKYFAYSVAASGSDWQEIYIMDFKTRKLLNEKIEYVKFSGISWLGDDGFYYSGYSRPQNEKTKYSVKTEYQKVYYHKVGTAQSQDKLVYEDKDHPLRYVGAGLTEDERFLILGISEGTDGIDIKVKDLTDKNANSFTTIVKGFATNADVIDNEGDKILLRTNNEAPNYKLVLVDPKNPEPGNWVTVIPEEKELLEFVSTGGGKLFAGYLKDVSTRVNQYSMQGKFEQQVKLPGIGTASGFGCKKNETYFYYSYTSFIYPPAIFKYDIKSETSTLFRKSEANFNVDEYEIRQVFYTSNDGTRVPMFIMHKKDISLNGNNPTMLYAYGGFNINITPAFNISIIPFLEEGGIYAIANIRGGGEYGEAWHKAGMLNKKQNVFDDFIAAAEYLIKERYTSPAKLAIRGGSNGGLLVGAVMTQRPDLFKVAIPQVGVLDMLRYHKFTVGWGWAVEYGSSDKKEDFDYLIKYSPLHNLKAGICYPATLITTADHDDRVVPAHSFKFAAELQKDQGCDNPTLIRIDSKAGHGAGKPTTKTIEELADIWSFTLYNMQ